MMRNAPSNRRRAILLLAAATLGLARTAQAEYAPIYGGFTYDAASGTGYLYRDGAPAVNDNGVAVGHANKFVSGTHKGYRAVLWDSTGSAVELGNLGTDFEGAALSAAYSINPAGQVAGFASKPYLGTRAVRWDTSGSVLELGNLGTSSGFTHAGANAINTAGQTAGWAQKYVGGTFQGQRAVRWSSTGSALELEILGTDASGVTSSYAASINDAGQTAGYAHKYVGGMLKGSRAVRWDADGSALELESLGTDALTASYANSINAAGQTVGSVSTSSQGYRATYWNADGSVVDLNTLISPSSNWTLTSAQAISDGGWVAGYGNYDPDGAGGVEPYERHFLLDISPATSLLGDLNNDAMVDATDIDLLCDRINAGTGPISPFDVNNDGSVNQADVNFEVTVILDTRFGDTDTDGDVDLNDLGNLASGFGIAGEKRWSKGNFDCDNDVDLNDLGTLATNFEGGRAEALAAFGALVPEPTAAGTLILAWAAGMQRRRCRQSPLIMAV